MSVRPLRMLVWQMPDGQDMEVHPSQVDELIPPTDRTWDEIPPAEFAGLVRREASRRGANR